MPLDLDALEALRWGLRNESGEALTALQHLRQRAAEKQKSRKG